MRAFKHISKREDGELRKIFPTFDLSELQDDESIVKLPISLWDKWYEDVTNKEDELPFECNEQEELLRYKKFHDLAGDIINNFEVYGVFCRQDKLKKVRSKFQLIADLNRNNFVLRPLLIPALKAIYEVSYDFTAFLYCNNSYEAKPLLELAYARGLKLISYK